MQKLIDVIKYRENCPICGNALNIEVNYNTSTDFGEIEYKFIWDKYLCELNLKSDIDEISDPNCTKFTTQNIPEIIEFKDIKAKIDLINNKVIIPYEEYVGGDFSITIRCDHEIEYIYYSFIDFVLGLNKNAIDTKVKDDQIIYEFEIEEPTIYSESIKVYNLSNDLNQGNYVRVVNNFKKQKTVILFMQAKLNTENQPFYQTIEKDLLPKEFFKYNNSDKVVNRINALLLLQ